MIEISFNNIINLTPHPVVVFDEHDRRITSFPPSDMVARVETERKTVANLNVRGVKVPIVKMKTGEVVGVPEPQEDTIYIVSLMTARFLPHRKDLYVADMCVKDKYTGKVIGCRGLTRPTIDLEICPYCGGHNPKEAWFCCHCGAI